MTTALVILAVAFGAVILLVLCATLCAPFLEGPNCPDGIDPFTGERR